jgi:phosphoglycolate phosphatase
VPAGFIFDLDGTLADSFADIAASLNRTREFFGHPPLPQPEIVRHVGSGPEYLVRTLVPVPETRCAEAFRFYLKRYEENALEQTRLFPGVSEVLAHYALFPLAVVTNKTQRLSDHILQGLGVRNRFRVVLGGDALERKKPDPLPLLHALEVFGLPPEQVAMVGDGLHDLHAGRLAGVITVAVTTGVEDRDTLASENPDHLIGSMAELPGCFQSAPDAR